MCPVDVLGLAHIDRRYDAG